MARKQRSWERGKFNSVVIDGKGKAVQSRDGAVMSRSFDKPRTLKVTTSRAEGAASNTSRSEVLDYGPKTRAVRNPNPLKHTGPRTRPTNNSPKAEPLSYGPSKRRGPRRRQDTGRVPGRAIGRAFMNAIRGSGPTDPTEVLKAARPGGGSRSTPPKSPSTSRRPSTGSRNRKNNR